ncbi:hypothetical protein CG398_07890, partial [Bifidobacteriaceae bacterium NR003]
MEAYKKAAEKLHNAITNKLPRDTANGQDIPDKNIPEKNGDLNDSKYLDNIQAHKNGEPLDRDVDAILKEMNAAAAELNKFATKTDELIKSINEDDNTKQTPGYKNTEKPDYKGEDGTTADTNKNSEASAARKAYDDALDAAKKVMLNPSATQADVDSAKKKLDEARKALKDYNTTVDKLKSSVDKNGKEAEGTNPAVEGTKDSDAYRNASDPHFLNDQGKPDTKKNDAAKKAKADYDKALAEAQELLAKHDNNDTPLDAKPTQKQIDEALKTLDEARKKLEDNYKTVTTKLDEEAQKSQADGATAPTAGQFEDSPEFKNADAKKGEGNKDNDDVDSYKKALKAARDLLSKKDATN